MMSLFSEHSPAAPLAYPTSQSYQASRADRSIDPKIYFKPIDPMQQIQPIQEIQPIPEFDPIQEMQTTLELQTDEELSDDDCDGPYLGLFGGSHFADPGCRLGQDFRTACWDGHVTSTKKVLRSALQPLYHGPLPDLYRANPEALWDELQMVKAELQFLAINVQRFHIDEQDVFECKRCRMTLPGLLDCENGLCISCVEVMRAPDNHKSCDCDGCRARDASPVRELSSPCYCAKPCDHKRK